MLKKTNKIHKHLKKNDDSSDMALDSVQRGVLCELDCDSRQSLASIGRVVRLSKESVHHRIKQLEERGVILGYPAIVSLGKRGKLHAEIYLRFHNVTTSQKREMIAWFSSQHEIVSVVSCKGEWDLAIGAVVEDLQALSELKCRIEDAYALRIAQSSLSLTVETHFYGRKYLMGKHIHPRLHVDKPGSANLDEIDERILSVLARDARATYTELGDEVGSSARSITTRIRRMVKDGVIQKFTVALDLEALGLYEFRLFLRLKDSAVKASILEYLEHEPHAVRVREVLADWSLEPSFEVASPEEFYAITADLEERFGSSIMSHTSLMVDANHKNTYYY